MTTMSSRLKRLEAATPSREPMDIVRVIVEPLHDSAGALVGSRVIGNLQRVAGKYLDFVASGMEAHDGQHA